MTPLRQALNAAILTVGMAVATPGSAQELAPIGPPPAHELAAREAPAPVVAPQPKPAAPATPPDWLATRPAPKKAAVAGGQSAIPSLGRLLGLAVVLGSLGGAVIYFKRKGRVQSQLPKRAQRLLVVSSTRIGPKAHAVVIAVAGRQMLLGVTDSSVKRLAFIDELTEEEEQEERQRSRERDPMRRQAEQARERGAGIAVRTVAPEPPKPGSFSDILRTAFGRRPAPVEADAASILAAETQDIVGGRPVPSSPGKVRMLDVEGQAQGLLRRLGNGPKV